MMKREASREYPCCKIFELCEYEKYNFAWLLLILYHIVDSYVIMLKMFSVINYYYLKKSVEEYQLLADSN